MADASTLILKGKLGPGPKKKAELKAEKEAKERDRVETPEVTDLRRAYDAARQAFETRAAGMAVTYRSGQKLAGQFDGLAEWLRQRLPVEEWVPFVWIALESWCGVRAPFPNEMRADAAMLRYAEWKKEMANRPIEAIVTIELETLSRRLRELASAGMTDKEAYQELLATPVKDLSPVSYVVLGFREGGDLGQRAVNEFWADAVSIYQLNTKWYDRAFGDLIPAPLAEKGRP